MIMDDNARSVGSVPPQLREELERKEIEVSIENVVYFVNVIL